MPEKLNIKDTKWNLTSLFTGDDDPKIEEAKKVFEEKSYEFINKWKERTDYLENPEVLKEALDDYEQWTSECKNGGSAFYYFWLRQNQEQSNPVVKAGYNKVNDLFVKVNNDINFFEIKLSKVSEEKQQEFLEYEPLIEYKHFLERLFVQAKHILTEDQEKILALMSKTSFENWTNMTEEFLSKEEREVLDENGKKSSKNLSEISNLINSKKKEVRDDAAKALNDILEKNSSVAEAEINSVLSFGKTTNDLRNFTRPDAGRHLEDDIDSEVVDTLTETVTERFSIANRYYELKAKLLGLEKLEYHERNVVYGSIDKKYSYEDAINLTYKVFKDLDPYFADVLKQFAENGQIDVFPAKGKTGGAFCIDWSKHLPGSVLLNFTDSLTDVTTIAHEFGHAINHELMKSNQNALHTGTVLSIAEVASTFMEDFVLDGILKEADDELRLILMMERLNSDISKIARQVACYNFEKELHKEFKEKGFLPKEEVGKIFQKHMSAYMGEFVELSEGSQNWWIYWSHIRIFFYVYSYASGLLISKSLQNSVKQNPEFIEKVKTFLAAGKSDSPKNIFMNMGIDITDKAFWNKGLDEVENLLKETEALAKKLRKI